MTNEEKAKIILGADKVEQLPQKGNRNIGMFVSVGGHKFKERFERAVCKFYKGDGSTPGFREGYMPYHKRDFPRIEALKNNRLIQQSLDSGVFENGCEASPYSVFQFIEGKMLRDAVGTKEKPLSAPSVSPEEAKSILNDMFCGVWIPLWEAGLRFKDGHTGNWILGADGRAYMIDTEQMRKDAAEFLQTPNSWAQRDKHEKMCLRLAKGIFADLLNACGKRASDACAEKVLKQTSFFEHLHDLGRGASTADAAKAEFQKCIGLLF